MMTDILQDLEQYKQISKEEVASIVANCNMKICIKLEDATQTYDLFEKIANLPSENTQNEMVEK